MARLATGSSNISNAGARAKARKASLIDSTRIRQLLQQGTDSIGASIGELGYRQEMDLYSTRMSGSDAIRFKKVVIASTPSINPSSIFTSSI